MRHDDHKFEWSQQEFAEYCEKVAKAYKYSFRTTGVGLPEDFAKNGFCSQIGVFTRLSMKKQRKQSSGNFELIKRCMVPANYPKNFYEKFFNDFLYSLTVARNWIEADYTEGVPISKIFQVPSMHMLCDGSFFRFQKLIKEVLPKFSRDHHLIDNCIYTDYDESSENSD